MKRVALALAIAAVVVAAPRLVLIFLEADSIQPTKALRGALLGVSGAALALVLTGGAAFQVHAVVRVKRLQPVLFGLWLVILTCIAVLITPRLVAGLRHATTPLAQVLSTDLLRWSWSFVAVLAAELVATGCMLAYAAEHRQQHELEQLYSELEQLGRSKNRIQQQLRAAQQQLKQQQQLAASPELAAGPDGELLVAASGQQLAQGAGDQPAASAGEQQLAPAASAELEAAADQQPAEPASPQPAASRASQQLDRSASQEELAAGAEPAAPSTSNTSSASRASSNGSASDGPAVPCRFGCGYLAANSHAERGHLASCPERPKRKRNYDSSGPSALQDSEPSHG